MSNKFEVELSYDPEEVARQDQLILRPLKNFMFEPVGVDKYEGYRCITVGINSDVAAGVHIVNALQESVRLLEEKGAKLTTTVYAMSRSVDFETPATVDQATVMKVKDLANSAVEGYKAELNTFNGGMTVTFENLSHFNEFKKASESQLKGLEDKGVKISENPVRNQIYSIPNNANEGKLGSAFGTP